MYYKFHGFISYNSKDTSDVEKLYELLTNSNLSIFFDKKINKAQTNAEKINDGLIQSKSLILVIGKNGISSSHQTSEIDTFYNSFYIKDKDTRKILIFLLDNINEEDIFLHLRSIDRIACKNISDVTDVGTLKLCELLQKGFIKKEDLELRPFTKNEFQTLQINTINWYNNNSEHFYELWKDDIPSTIDTFLRLVKQSNINPIVLDAGCGPGHHTNYLTNNGCKVIGIDLASSMIELAKKNRINSEQIFFKGDFTKLHNIPNIGRFYFDGIWAAGTFIHINEEFIKTHLHNCLAYLKPGGFLGVSFQINFPSGTDAEGRFFERYHSLTKIERIIRDTGFDILSHTVTNENNVKKFKKKIKQWVCFFCQSPNRLVL